MTLLTLGGCARGVLDPRGPIAAAEKTILLNSLAIMLVIVTPTIIATLAAAWWFRASNPRASYRPDFVYSGRVELVVWSIPVMVVMLLGGIAWVGSHDLHPAKPIAAAAPPIDVQVVALDWKWLLIYPDRGIASVNQLVVPAGTPVRFSLTSSSVMNSFFVPQLGTQIYAMSGMVTRLHLQADEPGVFRGFSAQYSGGGFSDMNFKVVAMPRDGFDRWATTVSTEGAALDDAAVAKLLRPGRNLPATAYRSASPDLFEKIVHMHEDGPVKRGRFCSPGIEDHHAR